MTTTTDKMTVYHQMVGDLFERMRKYRARFDYPYTVYVVFKRSTLTEYGAFDLINQFDPCPEGFEVVAGLFVGPGLSHSQACNKLRPILRTLPVLPGGE